ncbi:MAG: DUF1295 domain-containing protein [Deltaproteobacteria bacterium]|nr:DUF1295 domain-containing protein [Deltaproteobacteria bacterium]
MTRAFTWIAVAYAVALAAAVGVAQWVDAPNPLWVALWADVAATCVIFAFSVAFRNSSFYDAYWSLAPIAIVVYWMQGSGAGVPAARQALVALLVLLWALRLTGNWARGWAGLGHEDWRYVNLQQQTGRLYWLVSFGGIHMLPTLWVFGGCLALYPALATGTGALGALDALAGVVTGVAIWLEFQADQELRRFRTAPARRTEDVLDTGLLVGALAVRRSRRRFVVVDRGRAVVDHADVPLREPPHDRDANARAPTRSLCGLPTANPDGVALAVEAWLLACVPKPADLGRLAPNPRTLGRTPGPEKRTATIWFPSGFGAAAQRGAKTRQIPRNIGA